MLHEIPAAEAAEHSTTGACPCIPLRAVGERPGHSVGVLLIHHDFRPHLDQAAGDER